jgi:translation initiation factor IF-2
MRRQADLPFGQQQPRLGRIAGSARGRAGQQRGHVPSFSPPRMTRGRPTPAPRAAPGSDQRMTPHRLAHLAARQNRAEQAAIVAGVRVPPCPASRSRSSNSARLFAAGPTDHHARRLTPGRRPDPRPAPGGATWASAPCARVRPTPPAPSASHSGPGHGTRRAALPPSRAGRRPWERPGRRRSRSSSSRVRRRWSPRSAPLAVSGCFSSASSAAAVSRWPPEQRPHGAATGRGRTAPAARPRCRRARMPQRSSAAATRRVSSRSGVIRPRSRCPLRPPAAGSARWPAPRPAGRGPRSASDGRWHRAGRAGAGLRSASGRSPARGAATARQGG